MLLPLPLKSEVVATKATVDQKARWAMAAHSRGLKMAEWLRELAERETSALSKEVPAGRPAAAP